MRLTCSIRALVGLHASLGGLPVDALRVHGLLDASLARSAEEHMQHPGPEPSPAGTLVAGEVGGQQLDVLIAGDDEAAKQTVSQLASDGGLRPIDVGPLNGARQLEQLGFLHSPQTLALRSMALLGTQAKKGQ